MATRGGAGRLVTGNPLGGILRDLNRQARRPARRMGTAPVRSPAEGPAKLSTESGTAWPRVACTVATVAVTGEDGRVRVEFATPFARPPALAVVPVDPEPQNDDRTVTAAVEEAGSWYAVVRVWRTRPRRGTGVAEPAGAGVRVHVTAFEAGPDAP